MKHVKYIFYFILIQIMEDAKRKNNKGKRKKREVKSVVSSYLHQRNYCNLQTFLITKKQQITQALVETAVGRPNSILYRCDPLVIEQNFTKFLFWLREQTNFKNHEHDVERMVAPLFCHIYMEILRYEHSDRAASFFKSHFQLLNENNCDRTIRELFFANGEVRKDISKYKEKFRSNRMVVQVDSEFLKKLKKFVLENCHIMFVQVLQTYFDFQMNDFIRKENDKVIHRQSLNNDQKYENFINVRRDLKNEPTPVFTVHINNNKHNIPCGLLRRQCGLVILAENNALRLMPLHPMDSILGLNVSGHLKFMHHSKYIYSVDISSNNKVLVSGSADGTLCIYDLVNLRLVKRCTGHLGSIYCVKISSNCLYVATGSSDGTGRLWHVKNGRLIRTFCGHIQAVTSLEFHPNCLYIATGSADRNIRLWCVNKANTLRLLHASKGTIYNLAFSPCGKLIASASDDKSVRIWDILNSKVIIEFKCKDSSLFKVIWKFDGSEICVGSLDGTIRVWSVTRTHNGENKYADPIVTRSLNAKLLSIDYAFGTFGILTV
ncbi:TAF5-like RNA polymerase II p300/CBP-associated factor-associated factor 65 kDa subunit 5L [Diorhabda carinulata]|uniref:TAF5-like RNA polymerase II p300/CBP-associated factor-associated factor 65 kDa subunit 5L n=1 Tax=Diorhabda carinulata TaxID=1163345 RepID=UPI0025A19425|nr:TAF5-like RNA polymerase II p300/CBP-associated factor-associated factor 65 kDa subunit 5L [Diorhabda carinulata]